MQRRVLTILVVVGLTLSLAPAVASAAEQGYTYEVQTRGQVATSPSAFARDARQILGDARGWTLGGSVAFRAVSSGGNFNLILASPQAVENAAPVCSRHYSCRVGDNVYINDRNWRDMTPAFRNAGGDLRTYREYLINHEVGHYLGFGHFDCGGRGQAAPVMQQQSISLDGCEPNGWPLGFERRRLGERLGVPVYDDWVFTDVPRGVPHQGSIDELADTGLTSGFDDGTFRPLGEISRAHMAAFLARALDLEHTGAPDFVDVPSDHTHADAIAAVAEAGVAGGYGDGRFGPDDTVNRGQMATFLAQGFGFRPQGDPPFDDVAAEHAHAASIAAVAVAGVAEGHGDGTFRSAAVLTRGQMATFLVRAITAAPSEDDPAYGIDSIEVDAEPDQETARLRHGIVGANGEVDRVTFEFDGPVVPGFEVGYDEPPFHERPSGEEIDIEGESFLHVSLAPAGDYEGPERSYGVTHAITELVLSGDHEDEVSWVVGIDRDDTVFRVRILEDPARVVIEIRPRD